MAKSSAAKTIRKFEDGVCTLCGHDFDQHIGPGETTAGPLTCPPLPPPKQVTVDEAVVSKGGKPSTDFERELAAGLAADETAERKKLTLVHFEKPLGEPVTLDINVANLKPMKGNPRGDELGDTSGLEKVMEVVGFLGVLMVRRIFSREGEMTDDFEVISGNRRLQAAKRVGLKSVPCDVYEMDDVQALEVNMAEQTNRVDLSPLMEGDACRKLIELAGYTEHQVGEKFGKSASWVTKRVALVGIAPELRKAVTKGELAVTLANALAALPTHAQQLKAFTALDERPDWDKRGATAESDVQWLREKMCRPLSDATWKLTDGDLVPEVGACSTCPFNSSNAKMPGLFDNAKAKPTCGNTPCFDDKALAAWLAKTAKQKAAGAKVLSLGEGRKLFGNGNALPTSSRYVEASDKPSKDKAGRTWAELVDDVPEEHRPQLHLAQDNAGKVRSLYVHDKVMEAAATHLKLRWAKSVVEEAQERAPTPEKKAQQQAEMLEQQLIRKVRDEVVDSVINRVAAKYATDVTTWLPQLRFLASRLGERALERFGEATGKKKFPKDWVEKGATPAELLAFVWLDDAHDELHSWEGYDDRLLALAKAHGIDVEAATKAQLATAKAEALKEKGPMS